MAAYRARRIEEFQGEKALICTCFGVSEETIIGAIAENGFTEVEQVSKAYRAGSGCGSCRFLIQELIDMRDE
jgi:NifU-like protein